MKEKIDPKMTVNNFRAKFTNYKKFSIFQFLIINILFFGKLYLFKYIHVNLKKILNLMLETILRLQILNDSKIYFLRLLES